MTLSRRSGLVPGLLLLPSLARIPLAGDPFMLIFLSLGVGVVVRYSSVEPWNFIALLEEDKS